MIPLLVSGGMVAVAELLGQVLGEVADAPGRVLGPGEHALGVELGPEPGHVPRVIVRADCVKAVLKIKAALHAAPRPALTPVLSLGRPGRRAPASTPQPTANQPDSPGHATGGAWCRLTRVSIVPPPAATSGSPCGVAAQSASPNQDRVSTRQGSGACEEERRAGCYA